jgi:uncharacterized protein with PIN domain
MTLIKERCNNCNNVLIFDTIKGKRHEGFLKKFSLKCKKHNLLGWDGKNCTRCKKPTKEIIEVNIQHEEKRTGRNYWYCEACSQITFKEALKYDALSTNSGESEE